MKTTSFLVAVVTLIWTGAAAADEIWGVKSHDPVSGPPATLFGFAGTGGPLNVVGVVTLDGTPIDVDGLALALDGTLFGFEVSLTIQHSRLITIDCTTAAATVRGPFLEGRDIRGAAITSSGRLLALDTVTNRLLEFEPQTGLPFGPEIELSLESAVFDVFNVVDLTSVGAQSLILGQGNEYFALDAATGQLTLLHRDLASGPDGLGIGAAGLAWMPHAPGGPRLAVYDVQQDDDIFLYDQANAYTRTGLYLHIISAYNAGRGDLASAPSTVVGSLDDTPPRSLNLLEAHPNPFNPRTTISFSVSRATEVRVSVVDLAGRHVRDLANGMFDAGRHDVPWEGRDDQGRTVPAGVYVCRAEVAGQTVSTRLALVK